ncbi:hypothetical protein ANO11243_018130 [Dothideomycetidae sp. 11243]|nr:hypothetical protein ANO11243_018130 [fungal sp. No.11243]
MSFPMSHTSLFNCVGDALYQVLSSLALTDLLSLCLVSNGTRVCAEPYIYSDIQMTWQGDATPRFPHLVRTILRRPDLAACVRKVSLLGDIRDHGTPPPKSPAIQPSKSTGILLWRQSHIPGRINVTYGLKA